MFDFVTWLITVMACAIILVPTALALLILVLIRNPNDKA